MPWKPEMKTVWTDGYDTAKGTTFEKEIELLLFDM